MIKVLRVKISIFRPLPLGLGWGSGRPTIIPTGTVGTPAGSAPTCSLASVTVSNEVYEVL